jgi:anaerobic magnesium-protoporphyrin IX monomethyl ester cyclase
VNVLLVEINPFAPVSTPISLGYLAAYLMAHGFSVEILALGQNSSLSRSGLKTLISTFRPGLLGFSVHQRTIPYVLGLADFVKSLNPEIKIAIGGPQATFMPSAALSQMPSVDYICRSSGEETILAVARAIDHGAPFSDLAGVSYQDTDGNIFDTPAIEGSPDLDKYPSPYLHDVFDYSQMREAIMLTSRGCTHGCIFCYTPRAFNRKITLHSVDRVIEEIRWIGKKGIRRLWFADPSISYQGERLEALLERMLSEGLESEIWLQTRVDLVNPAMMKLMQRVGVSTIAFGLESASEKVRSRLRKKISIRKVREAIRMAQSHGIEVELFTMFGLPYESFDDALDTLDFVKENRVKIMGNTNSQQMQIYFGTLIERHYQDYDIRPLHSHRPAYLSVGTQYETDHMTHEEIRRIQNIWSSQSQDGGKRVVS